MKSPWKMIGQLISRAKPAEKATEGVQSDVDERAEDATASLAEPPQANTKPETSITAPDELPAEMKPKVVHTPDEGRSSDRQAHKAPASEVTRHRPNVRSSGAREAETSKAVVLPALGAQLGRSKRGSERRARQVAPPAEIHPNRSNRSFVTEIAEVDAAVQGLRRKLAEKLIEQNAQLRALLARFDRR